MLYLDTLWAFAQKVPHLCKCIVKDTKRDYVSIAMKKDFLLCFIVITVYIWRNNTLL